MIVRDFYFAAWAIEQGHGYSLKNGSVSLSVDTETLKKLKSDYASSHKACFDRVKKIIKDINSTRKG